MIRRRPGRILSIPPPALEMQLRRQHTMKRAGEFAYVRGLGSSSVGRHLILSTAPLPQRVGTQVSRFGIITTKRVGPAVVRNRLRRQVRELLREQGDALGNECYVVVVVRQSASGAGYDALRREMKRLIARHEKKEMEKTC